MSEVTDPRSPRRRGGPRERPLAPGPEVQEPVVAVVAVVAAPRRAAPPPPAAPSAREVTDFDGLRAIAELDPAAVRAMMDSVGSGGVRPTFREGQRVRGRVTSIGQQNVFLDVGGKADAALDRLEFGEIALGEVVDAFVVSTDGELRLTRSPSGSAAREMLVEAGKAKLPVNGKIFSVGEAGWQVMLADGIKAFCPASHTGAAEVTDETHVGQSLTFLIHDLRGRDVVVSRRALVQAEDRAVASQRMGTLSVNDVLEGTVSQVRDFGAFVKLPNALEGLVHISNVADRRVNHPSEVVKEGDVVKVRVLGIDLERRRIDLGIRQAVELSASPASRPSAAPVVRGFGQLAALLKDVKVRK